ncbi:MAG: RidA family protein [Anaerolineae bacterium]
MPKKLINPDSLARPIGYSYGVEISGGRLLVLAGQTAMDESGRTVGEGDMVAQFRQALANVQAVLEEAGGRMTDVVKLNIYVTDRDAYKGNLREIGGVYQTFFGRYFPAMTLVEISRLFDDEALIEIEGWALIDD